MNHLVKLAGIKKSPVVYQDGHVSCRGRQASTRQSQGRPTHANTSMRFTDVYLQQLRRYRG